jgi:hypothetical protein
MLYAALTGVMTAGPQTRRKADAGNVQNAFARLHVNIVCDTSAKSLAATESQR